MTRSFVAVIGGLFAACGASATAPAPPPPVGTNDCKQFADSAVEHCKVDEKASYEVCRDQARFAEAGGCITQSQRSFECSMQGMSTCSTEACCRTAIGGCAEINVELENCLRGYCTNHSGNPDCTAYFGKPASP